MDYEAILDFLHDARDRLEDGINDPHEDAEVIAEYFSKIKIVNQVIELVRNAQDNS